MIASIPAANYIVQKSVAARRGIYAEDLHHILWVANEKSMKETGKPLLSEKFVKVRGELKLLNVSALYGVQSWQPRKLPLRRPIGHTYDDYPICIKETSQYARFLDEAWNEHLKTDTI